MLQSKPCFFAGCTPGTTLFAVNYTGLKTDPGVFRFCQIEWIISVAPIFVREFQHQITQQPQLWQGFFWQRRTNKAMLFGYEA